MRRLLLLASSSVVLVACASILGDFDVAPPGTSTANLLDGSVGDASRDATTTEGGVKPPDSGSGDDDASVDAGDGGEGSDGVPQVVTVNQLATCATLKYGQKLVTFCWGSSTFAVPQVLGQPPPDMKMGNFALPRVPSSSELLIIGSPAFTVGGGSWFLAAANEGVQGANANNTYAWGVNSSSQTGVSAVDGGANTYPHLLRVDGNGAVIKPVDASGGLNHGCVVSGTKLYCWGKNQQCQTTGGPLASTCNSAGDIMAPKDVSSVVQFKGANDDYYRVAAGALHTCVVATSPGDKNANVDCWGNNDALQTGRMNPTLPTDPPTTEAAAPTGLTDTPPPGEIDLAAGDNHTCAIIKGTMWCWGLNDNGQSDPFGSTAPKLPTKLDPSKFKGDLANGTLSSPSLGGNASCVLVGGFLKRTRIACFGTGALGRDVAHLTDEVGPVAGVVDVTQFAISKNHGCAIGRAEGDPLTAKMRLFCWGENTNHAADPAGPAGIIPTTEVVFPKL